jgi:hypothetical protein
MRATLAAAAGVVAAGVLASLAYGATTVHPILRLVASSPVKVHGAHFRSAERVRVTFDLGAQNVVRTLRANRAGSFTASTDADFDRCGTLVVIRAVGARSGAATVKLQLPECAPNP